MNKLVVFDVLIVYTESLADSAACDDVSCDRPFAIGSASEPYNLVYGYFLEECYKIGLNVALTTSADIVGAGRCSSYWTYKRGVWCKVKRVGYASLIFDKFSPTKRRIQISRNKLFSSNEIKPFNDPELFDVFFDKKKTYDELREFSIPTVTIDDRTKTGVKKACTKLKKMMQGFEKSMDFSGEIVMKDQFGAGGRRVYKYKFSEQEKMLKKIRVHSKFSYIIQPLIMFDKGFEYQKSMCPTDIRLVYLKGKIVQAYIRRARLGDFRCNEHQGGTLSYVSLKDIPTSLIEKSNLIAEKLDQKNSFYALDFIVSNFGNIYFLEGNAGPGLDWNLSLKKNEREAKKLIRLIVKELSIMVDSKLVRNRGIFSLMKEKIYGVDYSV